MAREVYLADAAVDRKYGEFAEQPEFVVNRIYEIVHQQKKPVYEFVKRAADIFFSVIFLVLLSPVFLATAIAIRREDGGPAIYKQERMTKDGRIFTMYKFRSMRVHAEKYLEQLQKFNQIKDGPAFKMENDPRITKVGKFIRKTSIDELPQLINILKGEMTFVGPRPPLVSEVEKYNSYQRQRLGVKQGLTCFWQCSGRNNIGFEEWVALDLKYIKTRGVWTDVQILFKTVSAVFKMDGAC